MDNSISNVSSIKCVTVGDGGVGKTCLLVQYVEDRFQEDYTPTIFETRSIRVTIDEDDVDLNLWDTAGQEAYERLRPLAYKETDVFLLCFAVSVPDSYENIKNIWSNELKRHCPKAKILLVGTKVDLRNDPVTVKELHQIHEAPITTKEGHSLARGMKAVAYKECSAKTGQGVKDVFETAIRAVVKPDQLLRDRGGNDSDLLSCCNTCSLL